MADILCLDTEPETIAALKDAGHTVFPALFGYRNGVRSLQRAPQDFDLIVCDLRKPACFDSTRWGMTGNSNFNCTIIPGDQLNWDSRLAAINGAPPTREVVHRLIYETQIERMSAPSAFGPNDIRQAIALAGIPAIIFLNPEWVLRTGGHVFPAFVGLGWATGMTEARKFSVLNPLAALISSWDPPLAITNPIRCMLRSGPEIPLRARQGDYLEAQSIVVDRVDSALGQLVRCGKGLVWMIPATDDNAAAACHFADDLEAISRGPASATPDRPAEDTTSAGQRWDLFINHASEDKQFTDQLYDALKAEGVEVWYDKSVVKMGDSLRQKIEEGLARSRFGVVVLSPSFLNKRWAQAELSALFGMQMADGRPRILPIWHNIDRDEVARSFPLLLDFMASPSELGLDQNVKDILAAIDWPYGRVAVV
ncbi:MAG TPA: toll/interleukin-1 receptor domain-containing protein [Candidatus Sulfotelmatobacter sp.]|nr:toll/interleukin-1 receptor domain-containing protein [Candidatus Sulfotelmatobacter sp.]